MKKKFLAQPVEVKGWRPGPWGEAVGCGHVKTADLIKRKVVPSVKIGRCRVILISPGDFLQQQYEQQQATA